MSSIIKVKYSYECPTDNYLDGTEFETIEGIYEGESFLWLVVHNDTGEFETVLRDWEVNDGRPTPLNHAFVKIDCSVYPLVAEVLSDYHDNYKNDPEYLYTPGEKTIKTPDGYQEFSYEYPIHPDHLFDDKKSTYNWETGKVELYRNKNIDIMGTPTSWDDLRRRRNAMLQQTDALSLVLKDVNPDKYAEIEDYRQKLRDLPDELSGVSIEYVASSFPKTTLIEL